MGEEGFRGEKKGKGERKKERGGVVEGRGRKMKGSSRAAHRSTQL